LRPLGWRRLGRRRRFARQGPGPRVVCVFVDNGLLRAGERDSVAEAFGRHSNAELRVVDARQRFLDALHGISDPQEKRVRIGHTFIDVFRNEAETIPTRASGAGHALPDVIESGGDRDGPGRDDQAPPQRGGTPEVLGFELIEPLRDLFKTKSGASATSSAYPTRSSGVIPSPALVSPSAASER